MCTYCIIYAALLSEWKAMLSAVFIYCFFMKQILSTLVHTLSTLDNVSPRLVCMWFKKKMFSSPAQAPVLVSNSTNVLSSTLKPLEEDTTSGYLSIQVTSISLYTKVLMYIPEELYCV